MTLRRKAVQSADALLGCAQRETGMSNFEGTTLSTYFNTFSSHN